MELEKNNSSTLAKDNEMSEGIITKHFKILEPPELWERIQDSQEFWKRNNKGEL